MGIAIISILAHIAIGILLYFVLTAQTENKTKVFIRCAILLVLLTTGKEIHDYFKNLPQPNVILERIDSVSNKNPPDEICFQLKLKNVGNAVAKNVYAQYCFTLNRQIAIAKVSNKKNLEPLETIVLEQTFGGDTLRGIWNEETKLELLFRIYYTKKFGRKGVMIYYRVFQPNKDSRVYNPSWKLESIDKNEFNDLFFLIFEKSKKNQK